MITYQLVVKMMRCVDRNNKDVPGLPLKYLITMDDRQIGFFETKSMPVNNVMCFNMDGDHLWTIAAAPNIPENFSKSWSSIYISESGAFCARASNDIEYVIDIQTGLIG